MLKFVAVFLLVVTSVSFSQTGLTFKIEKFSKDYTNPKDASEKFLEFHLEYPVFSGTGAAEQTAKFLNEQVSEIVFEKEGSPEALFNKTVKDHKEIYAESEGMGMQWMLEKTVQYNKLTEDVGTLTYSGSQYSGGAHGGAWVNYFNYDLKNNKQLLLKDVLNTNFLPALTKEGEKIFRKLKNLKPNQSLEGDYWFTDNKFHLNENYLFTKTGITFYYNQYEITCYACGTTELEIPWKSIKSLINKNGLLKAFSK